MSLLTKPRAFRNNTHLLRVKASRGNVSQRGGKHVDFDLDIGRVCNASCFLTSLDPARRVKFTENNVRGRDQSATPHLVAAPAACWSWRTILLGEGPQTRGCSRSRGCCRARSLHIAIGPCTLEGGDIRLAALPQMGIF